MEALEHLEKLESETIEEQDAAIEGEIGGDQEQKEREQEQDQAAKAGAVMAVSFVETLVKMRWQFVQIEPEVKAQVIEKAVPVVKKYDAELPAWLKPYQEEIELGMVVAAAGFGVAMQVRMHNAEKAKQEAEQEPEQPPESNREHYQQGGDVDAVHASQSGYKS